MESLVFSLPIIKAAYQQDQPIIHFSESVPVRVLYKLRERLGGDFTLLFSNGGPMSPEHYMRFDYVQVLTPMQKRQALEAGFPEDRLFLVPYGLNCSCFEASKQSANLDLKDQFDLPKDRTIVLSVGAINTHHKRMDWLVREAARLDPSEYFFWMVGQKEGKETRDVKALAKEKLSDASYQFDTVSYDQMPAVYRAADLFALCSLHEGFGRVYIEAMAAERPVLAHPTPNTEWILGETNPGLVAMDKPGRLATQIEQMADDEALRGDLGTSNQRRAYEMFDWGQLKADYIEMYRAVAERER
ncbi:glycosyltransferase family 4 protein [Salisaeta longa]|uniref:glycosyltransferase family 4 protein n=1 Tax=Salisaeta longa TaxID=503170 RepID=UPI000409F413|nr:glycosyltransferase family 4 protein [Salisaeta longa]